MALLKFGLAAAVAVDAGTVRTWSAQPDAATTVTAAQIKHEATEMIFLIGCIIKT
jgi:hypothetical protein